MRRLAAVLTALVVALTVGLPALLISPLFHAPVYAADPLVPPLPPGAVTPPDAISAVAATGPTIFTSDTTLTTDTVWSPQGSPYVLLGSVKTMATLTLLPGTVVKLNGSMTELSIGNEGQLLVLGLPDKRVVITSYKDDTVLGDTNGDGSASAPAPGDWGRVSVQGPSLTSGTMLRTPTSIVNWADVRYGGYGSGGTGGQVQTGGAMPAVVANSIFADSYTSGVYTYQSPRGFAGIYNNTFRRSPLGILSFDGRGDIVGNTFEASITGRSIYASTPGKLRFWFNRAYQEVAFVGGPTRATADVRFNELIGGTREGYSELNDYSLNWWGTNLNAPGAVPTCATSVEADAFNPPLTIDTARPCAASGSYTVTGLRGPVNPTLSGIPRTLPVSLVEAAAPVYGGVNSHSGTLSYQATDLVVQDAGKQLTATRAYRSDQTGSGDAGTGWTTAFSETLSPYDGGSLLHLSDGSTLPFDTDLIAGYTPAPGVTADYTTGSAGSEITGNDNTTYQFDASGELTSILLGDKGHKVTVTKTGGELDKVTGVSGRYLDYTRTGGKLTTVADGNGRAVTLTYSSDRLTDVLAVDGQHETYEYDTAGRLNKIIAPSGLVKLAAGYGADGKVAWIEQLGQGRSAFAYDPATSTTTITRADQSTVVQRYDEHGRLIAEKNGSVWRHVVYDGDGRLVASINGIPETAMTGYAPTATGQLRDGHSDLIIASDPDGRATRTSYDTKHHPQTVTRPDASITSYVYDSDGRLQSATDPASHIWTYTSNTRGQVTGRIDPLNRTRTVTYEIDGDVAGTTDELGATTTFTNDNLGRRITITDHLGHAQQITYTAWDAPKTVTSARDGLTTVNYDTDRRRTSVTDPTGAVTTFEYDTNSRLTAVVDAENGRTTLGYDALGRAISVTDQRTKTYTITHTPEGWQATATDPDNNTTTYQRDPLGRVYRVTDPLGQITQTVYDHAGNTVKTWTPDGATQSTSYDLLGRPAQATTAGGYTWTTEYEPLGNISKTTNPYGWTTQATYDPVGRPLTQTDERGNTTTYAYNDALRATTVTDAIGTLSVTTFDILGRTISQADGDGVTTTYSFDADGNLHTSATAAGTWTYDYDLAGRQTSQTDPLQRITTTTYDHLGRTTGHHYPDTTTDTDAYDPAGNLTSHTDRTGATWLYRYDNRNQLVEAEDPLHATTSYTYDTLGRPTSVTDPTGVAAHTAYDPMSREAVRWDTTGAAWTTSYDLDGNPTKTVDPAGVVTNYRYDNLGRLTAGGWTNGDFGGFAYTYDKSDNVLTARVAFTTTYTYDARSRVTATTDGTNHTTTNAYDKGNRPTSQTTPSGHATSYTYDTSGRITSAQDPLGNTTSYAYDAADQLTQITLPRGGTYQYGYDSAGRVDRETDPLAKDTLFDYDGEGRLTQSTYPTGRTVTATYDTAGNRTTLQSGTQTRTYTYDTAGRLTSAAAAGNTVGYGYDNRGLLTKTTDSFGDTLYEYDTANRLTKVTPPTGTPTTYSYTRTSDRTSITVGGAITGRLDYDNEGRLRYRNWGPNYGFQSYEYDQAGRPTRYLNGTNTYDTDGRVATTTDTSTNPETVTTYGYDNADRLTSAAVTRGTSQLSASTYAWDADSNRASISNGVTTTTSTYDLADRLTRTSAGIVYAYDDDGSQTAVGTVVHGYNPFGELTTAGPTAYTRDALGRVATRTNNGTTETFGYADTSNTMTAWRAGTGPTSHLIRDPQSALIAVATDGSNTYQAYLNGHGDLTALRNPNVDAPEWRATYDAFGNVTSTTATQPTPVALGFQAMYTDPSTGLVDMGARNYDPTTGRFTTRDTIVGAVGAVGAPMSFNRYLYGNASPTNYNDPDGHWPELLDDVVDAVSDFLFGDDDSDSSYSGSSSSSSWWYWTGLDGGGASLWSQMQDAIQGTLSSVSSCIGDAHRCLENYGTWWQNEWNKGWGSGLGPSTASTPLGRALGGLVAGAVNAAGNSIAGAMQGITTAGSCLLGDQRGCATIRNRWSADGLRQAAEDLFAPVGQCLRTGDAETCGEAAFNIGSALLGVRGATELIGTLSRRAEHSGLSPRTTHSNEPSLDLGNCGGTATHSFNPDTPVLMADGTTKAIGEIKVGDQVIATNPESGQTAAQAVTAVHDNQDTDLTDVTVRDSTTGEVSVLHTTAHHPFWSATNDNWVDASDLSAGTRLRDDEGRETQQVVAVKTWTGLQQMRDLTVDDVHTYYVLAGDQPVLVHNCGGDIYEHGGSTRYGALDSQGRPTSVSSSVTSDMLDTGSDPLRSIKPPGWSGNGTIFNEARGHLLANRLGGSGRIPNNLVTITQDPVNTPIMRDFEGQIYDAVSGGQTVQYTSTAIYGDGLAPIGIQMEAYGSGGFCLGVCIMNPAGR